MNLVESIIFFLISFIVVFLIYIIFINKKRKEYKEGKKVTEINYLVKRFNLDLRKIKYKKIKWLVTIINSFIVALVSSIVIIIDSFLLQLLVGFILLILLTYSLYEITGRILKIKGEKNV